MAKKFYKINTMDDFVDMLNNNFVTTEAFAKTIKKSREAYAVGFIALVYASYAAVKCIKQKDEMKKLADRVEKLEHFVNYGNTEGE